MFFSKLECKNVVLKDVYPWEKGKFDTALTENANGEEINNGNYMDYIRRMMEYCLDKGIRAQIDAFTCRLRCHYLFCFDVDHFYNDGYLCSRGF